MVKNKGFFLVLLLSVFVISSNAAVEQEFEISKNLDGLNQQPRLAINTQTGDALVIWNHHTAGNTTDFSIYMAYCKRKSNGSYKVSKARMVSPSNHRCQFADVAYNPEDNSYMVVWSAFLNTPETTAEAELYSRKISASGKVKGTARNISKGVLLRGWRPVISYSPSSGGDASPAGKGGYLVVWYAKYFLNGESQYSGLFSQLLDQNGESASDGPNLIKKVIKKEEGYTSLKLMRMDDGNFVLSALFRIQLDPYIEQPVLIKIRSNGAFSKETVLEKNFGFSFAAVNLSKKLIFSYWRTEKYSVYQGVRAKNLKTFKKQPAEGISSFANENDMVKLGLDPGAYHVFSINDSLYGHYIDVRGKRERDPEYLFQEGNFIYEVAAAPLAGNNEIFVVVAIANDIIKDIAINAFVFDPLNRSPLE